MNGRRESKSRFALRLAMMAIYFVAGVFHLATPDSFLLITPAWVPFPRWVIFGTGVCEIAGSIALGTARFRRLAGYALAAYAVCVFPANVKHAIDGLPPGQIQLGLWYHVPRLLLQPVLVWWALFAADITDWPFRRHSRRAAAL
jgi:uncharacterized membrane protein